MSFRYAYRSFGVCCRQLVANIAPNCQSERQTANCEGATTNTGTSERIINIMSIAISHHSRGAGSRVHAKANGWHKANSTMCWQPSKWQLTVVGGCWLPTVGMAAWRLFSLKHQPSSIRNMANGGHDFSAARLISSLWHKCEGAPPPWIHTYICRYVCYISSQAIFGWFLSFDTFTQRTSAGYGVN